MSKYDAYVIRGVTDVEVQRSNVIKRSAENGCTTRLHFHRFVDPCNDKCEKYVNGVKS